MAAKAAVVSGISSSLRLITIPKSNTLTYAVNVSKSKNVTWSQLKVPVASVSSSGVSIMQTTRNAAWVQTVTPTA